MFVANCLPIKNELKGKGKEDQSIRSPAKRSDDSLSALEKGGKKVSFGTDDGTPVRRRWSRRSEMQETGGEIEEVGDAQVRLDRHGRRQGNSEGEEEEAEKEEEKKKEEEKEKKEVGYETEEVGTLRYIIFFFDNIS